MPNSNAAETSRRGEPVFSNRSCFITNVTRLKPLACDFTEAPVKNGRSVHPADRATRERERDNPSLNETEFTFYVCACLHW